VRVPPERLDMAFDPSALAVEIWRLRARLGRLDADQSEPYRSLWNSLDRIDRQLDALGVRIEDPIGKRYDDNMTLEVVHFEEGMSTATAHANISETIKPSIYVGNRIALVGQVIVTKGSLSDGNNQTADAAGDGSLPEPEAGEGLEAQVID